MDKLLYEAYYKILNMKSSEVLYNYYCFKNKHGSYDSDDNPTACGITSFAIINKLENIFGSVSMKGNLLDAKIYIMQNSNTVLKIGISTYRYSNGIFPGHSFVVIPLGSEKYMLLQSYIDHYSLSEWIEKKQIVYSKNEIIEIIDFMMMFETEKNFTKEMMKKWEQLTKVPLIIEEHQIKHGNTFIICLELE